MHHNAYNHHWPARITFFFGAVDTTPLVWLCIDWSVILLTMIALWLWYITTCAIITNWSVIGVWYARKPSCVLKPTHSGAKENRTGRRNSWWETIITGWSSVDVHYVCKGLYLDIQCQGIISKPLPNSLVMVQSNSSGCQQVHVVAAQILPSLGGMST